MVDGARRSVSAISLPEELLALIIMIAARPSAVSCS
jgi:hypothetical protein